MEYRVYYKPRSNQENTYNMKFFFFVDDTTIKTYSFKFVTTDIENTVGILIKSAYGVPFTLDNFAKNLIDILLTLDCQFVLPYLFYTNEGLKVDLFLIDTLSTWLVSNVSKLLLSQSFKMPYSELHERLGTLNVREGILNNVLIVDSIFNDLHEWKVLLQSGRDLNTIYEVLKHET